MEVLDERVQQRRDNFCFYKQAFKDIEGITFVEELRGFYSNRWLTTILVGPAKTSEGTREDIRLALEKDNIQSRPLWKPMHLQQVFKEFPYYGEGWQKNCLTRGCACLRRVIEKR